ncbi:MAG: class I SAM-dependent methyltransferase [Phycisphaerae bacterium]
MTRMQRKPEPELMDLPAEAAAYAEADFSRENSAFVEGLCQLARDVETARCVDLGAGPADIPVRIARTLSGWHITAVDAAGAMLRLARHRIEAESLSHRISLLQADASRTGLDSDSFDVLISNSILHHVADPIDFWHEAARLVRPGGLVFLRDLLRPESEARARELVECYAGQATDLLKEEFYRSLLAAYLPEEIEDQLRRAHLSGLKVRTVTDRHVDVFGHPD